MATQEMNLSVARRELRAASDDWFRKKGFLYLSSREAYALKFDEGLQLVHLRLVVVASIVRLELSASIRFERIEKEYHRTSGARAEHAAATSTLWITAEQLTGWPLDECHLRLATKEDVGVAAEKVRTFVEGYAERYFATHRAVEDVAFELNSAPLAPTPHAAPPVRAFYGVIAAALSGSKRLGEVIGAHREALKAVDRGFYNTQFESMVADLKRLES